jgi:hypothetical protein
LFTAEMCIKLALRMLALSAVLLLAACAGTKVDNFVSSAPTTLAAPPHSVAVIVEAPHNASVDVRRTQAVLAKQLSEKLASRDFTVVPAGEVSDLILRCRILEARSGNKALRLLVGYDAGMAQVQVDVALVDMSGRQLMGFQTRSTTGSMPGAVAGLMFPVNTAFDLATAGGGIAMGINQDLAERIGETSYRIDSQLQGYFQRQGWSYEGMQTVASVPGG